jgi:hypothetical protein
MRFKNAHRRTQGEEVKETAVCEWLNCLAANFYDEEIVKLVQRLDKCLNRNRDYVQYKHMLCLPDSRKYVCRNVTRFPELLI